MGRYAQAKMRGRTDYVPPSLIPAAPGVGDWDWYQQNNGSDMFAVVSTPGPAGYDQYEVQSGYDGDMGSVDSTQNISVESAGLVFEAGHDGTARVRYVSSGGVLPPGFWSDPKNLAFS